MSLSLLSICLNVLHKSYNIPFNEAYKIWEKAQVKKDPRVVEIINALIHSTPEGLPILLNRNPTIAYGWCTCNRRYILLHYIHWSTREVIL